MDKKNKSDVGAGSANGARELSLAIMIWKILAAAHPSRSLRRESPPHASRVIIWSSATVGSPSSHGSGPHPTDPWPRAACEAPASRAAARAAHARAPSQAPAGYPLGLGAACSACRGAGRRGSHLRIQKPSASGVQRGAGACCRHRGRAGSTRGHGHGHGSCALARTWGVCH